VDRREILSVIRRTAAVNGGIPLGTDRLAKLGITEAVWQRYWARIGDAQRDAGLSPNRRMRALPIEEVIAKLAGLARELGDFPTKRDIEVKHHQDHAFPSGTVFRRLGTKARLAHLLAEYTRAHPGHEDIAALCASVLAADAPASAPPSRAVQFGSVYLLKGPGRRYKIGRTNVFGRRRRELSIQLPFDTRKVHVIETDDPEGVERYWHARFTPRRINGEWFELDVEDVAAFKRWKRLR
jgi:hypothetical protein